MKKLTLALVFLAALSRPAPLCAESAGTSLFNFLSFDSNGRAAGMGGTYTALACNSSALAYNPAGLARGGRSEATFMHNQYFQDITQDYLSYASPHKWGAAVNYLNFGGIREATLSNPSGTGLGEVGLNDMAFSFGYGANIGDISAGAGLKFVRESIAGIAGQGFMLDAGVLWIVPGTGGLKLGAVVQNVGPDIKFQSTKEPLPLAMRAGAAYRVSLYSQKTTLALDVQKVRAEAVTFRLGAEVLIAGVVPLRAGYNTQNDDGPGISAGTGYATKTVNFDYAYVPFKTLGASHRFSVTFRWGS